MISLPRSGISENSDGVPSTPPWPSRVEHRLNQGADVAGREGGIGSTTALMRPSLNDLRPRPVEEQDEAFLQVHQAGAAGSMSAVTPAICCPSSDACTLAIDSGIGPEHKWIEGRLYLRRGTGPGATGVCTDEARCLKPSARWSPARWPRPHRGPHGRAARRRQCIALRRAVRVATSMAPASALPNKRTPPRLRFRASVRRAYPDRGFPTDAVRNRCRPQPASVLLLLTPIVPARFQVRSGAVLLLPEVKT